jgi:hypothetical protein
LPAPGDPAAIFTPRQFSSARALHTAVVARPRFLALPAIETPRSSAIVSTFDYLVALLRHHELVADEPARWLPWNYRQALDELRTSTTP